VNLDSYTRFLVSLVFVLALIALFAWLLRRFGPTTRLKPRGLRRLSVVEIVPIDARRRLVLLRRDDTEHLVLLGASQDLVIETGIKAGSAFATHLPEATP
jgi:flagellar protein FliO/FliZ